MLVARNRTFRAMILCRGVIYHVPNTLKFAERNVKEEQKRQQELVPNLSLIHISEPTRLGMISYAVFCLKKKKDMGKGRVI